MKLRTFTATDMPAAMKLVREAMGDDAIIISSKEVLNGKRAISVTAAVDTDTQDGVGAAPTLAAMQNDTEVDRLRFELQSILRFHNLPDLFVAKLLQKASDNELAAIIALHKIGSNRDAQKNLFRLALEKMTNAYFNFDPLPLDAAPSRIMLIGMPGIGKTMTIAKMAARLSMDGKPLTVITTDNKRAGGVEQLRAFTSILGLDLKIAPNAADLNTMLKRLPGYARVLVDTAGCNPHDAHDMGELHAFATLDNIEPVLVMPAGGDSEEALDIVEVFASLPVRRLLITQADTTRRFGSVLGAAAAHKLAFCNISSSSSITDTLKPIDAPLLSQLLLRYQLQSQ